MIDYKFKVENNCIIGEPTDGKVGDLISISFANKSGITVLMQYLPTELDYVQSVDRLARFKDRHNRVYEEGWSHNDTLPSSWEISPPNGIGPNEKACIDGIKGFDMFRGDHD